MYIVSSFVLFTITVHSGWTKTIDAFDTERIELCKNLKCDSLSDVKVCGIRKVNTTVRLKLFENECALLKYGCSVAHSDAYGLIGVEYCRRSTNIDGYFDTTPEDHVAANLLPTTNPEDNDGSDCNANCSYTHKDPLCAIRQDGGGYRVALFENTCELVKYNCIKTHNFIQTDMFICNGTLQMQNSTGNKHKTATSYENDVGNNKKPFETTKNIIVVDSSMLGKVHDVNETIDNFFASTHVLDLPIREIRKSRVNTRRRLVKLFGPVKVFQPWITIPKKILTDRLHEPTLSTCYHKCPTQCPDTYAPVCGVPGILAREPSLMFQNHCYMDVAQCKMYWENKSSTAASSSYIESSFLFCLGDQLNGLYRFLPLIKTLQHMGRLKKKGKFHYRMINMRFFNNYAYKEPKLMG